MQKKSVKLILLSVFCFSCLLLFALAANAAANPLNATFRLPQDAINAISSGGFVWSDGDKSFVRNVEFTENDILQAPAAPNWSGHRFVGWMDQQTHIVYKTNSLEGACNFRDNVSFIALFDTRIGAATVQHWLYGFENNEGTSPDKKGIKVEDRTVYFDFGDQYNYLILMSLLKINQNELSDKRPLMNSLNTNGFDLDGVYTYYNHNTGTNGTEKIRIDGMYLNYFYYQINSNLLLEYRYNPINYSISYNLAGGAFADMNPNPSTYNVLNGFMLTGVPKKAGYTFLNWEVGNKKVLGVNGEPIKKAALINSSRTSSSALITELNKRFSGNLSVVANFEPNTIRYNITYDLQGGKFSRGFDDLTYTNGQPEAVNPTVEAYGGSPDMYKWFFVQAPTKAGFTFQGWTISGMDTCTHHYYPGSTSTNNVTTYTTKANSFYDLRSSKGTVNFKANWKANNYTVEYYFNGKLVGTQNCTYAVSTKTRELQKFPGRHLVNGLYWNTKEDFSGTNIGSSFSGLTTKNGGLVKLYAKDTPNIATVKLLLNDSAWNSYSQKNNLNPELRLSTDTTKVYQMTRKAGTNTFTASSIPNGTYKVYNAWSNASVQKYQVGTLTISDNNASASAKYYSVSLTKGTGVTSATSSYAWVARTGTVTVKSVVDPAYRNTGFYGLKGSADFKTSASAYTIKSIKERWMLTASASKLYTATFKSPGTWNDGTTANKTVKYIIGELMTPAAVKARTGYTFKGWKVTAVAEGGKWVSGTVYAPGTKIKGVLGNVTLSPVWSQNQYTATITHWLYGFKNGTGTNADKNAVRLAISTKKYVYGANNVTITASDILQNLPAGIAVAKQNSVPKFGSYLDAATSAKGTAWKSYAAPKTFTKVNYSAAFQYSYYLINYKITYDLGGGELPAANPATYNIVYGAKFTNKPVKYGYTFVGWSLNGVKVTGVNTTALPSSVLVNGSSTEASQKLLEALRNRTSGNITVKALWHKCDPIKPFGSQKYVSMARSSGTRIGYDFMCYGSSAPTLGKSVCSVYAGTVKAVGWSATYGNYVLIDHGNGVNTFYARLMCEENKNANRKTTTPVVKVGQTVTKGQVIGHAGATYGTSSTTQTPHLYFEIRIDGKPVDVSTFAPPIS